MEDLFVDTGDELLMEERFTETSDMELYPNLVANDWNRDPTPEDRHISDSSLPDFEDPLDSILRRQLPQPIQFSPSEDSEADQQPKPIESRVDDPPHKRKSRPPQRYSPPITSEPTSGTSDFPQEQTDRYGEGGPRKILLQRKCPDAEGGLQRETLLN